MTICLLGIGNVLMGDDALGPWVIETLRAAWSFPPGVVLVDAGTPGLDLTAFLDGFDALIAVDALHLDAPAGTVRSFRRAELLAAKLPVVMSPHEPTLREALMRLQLLGRGPSSVLLVGAVPEQVAAGAPLSKALRAAVSEIEARVQAELARLGAAAVRRPEPCVPNIWWERSAACASASPAR